MSSVLNDGIYSLAYRSVAGEAVCANGLAIVRNNQIMGSDEAGGIFNIRFLLSEFNHAGAFEGRLSLPPDGELITGLRAGPEGLDIPIHGKTVSTDTLLQFIVQVADQAIEVDAAYVGPLPCALDSSRSTAQR